MEFLCREEIEQGRLARDVAAAEAWGGARAREEAEWAAVLLQAREEAAYARIAVRRCRTLLGNLVVERLVPTAGRE